MVCILSNVAFGQPQTTKRHITAVKVVVPPVIDGDLSDSCWQTAPTAAEFVDIQNGNHVPDQTTTKILYDEKYIYVGFDCRDSRPEGIVARETVRDMKFQQNSNNGALNNEDNVEIDFDPFLTHQGNDMSQFSVNALGTRSAALAGGRGSKAEWKGDWDAAVKRNVHGWTCEMRIPWASLNYPATSKPITIGIDFQRFQDRTKINSIWSNITTQGFIENEGLWDNVEVPHALFHPKLSLLPYLLTGIQNDQTSSKIGMDARYSFTPQLTGVASYNPDFSTVQDSILSITYSHVPHSVQEQRPFFQEGGNYFYDQTNINDIGLYFYSPSITTFDLGAKLYGKLAPKDTIGVLDTDSFSGRNDFVGRYEHSFSDTSSGGLMIVQDDTPAGDNTVGVVDEHIRTGKLAFETVAANSAGPGAGGGAQNISTYYADKFLTSMIQFSGVSNDFLTPVGYIPYTGYKGFTSVEDWSAQWRNGPLRSTELTIVPIYWWQENDLLYFRGIQGSYNVETRNDWHFELDYTHMEFLDTTDSTIGFNVVDGVTNRFRQFGLQFNTGELGSVPETFFGPFMNLRVMKKMDVSVNGVFQNRDGLIQQHIGTLNYEITPTRSIGGRVVLQNGDTNAYLFFHESGGKGTEYYFILGDPNALRTVRSAQLKVVFSF